MKKFKFLSFLFIFMLAGSFALTAQNNAQKSAGKQQVSQKKQQVSRKEEEEKRFRNDWANLARFRDDNTKIGLPADGEKRVVFMGNSITEGWIRLHPEFFSSKPYVNRGISGQTTPQMLVRFRPDVINLKPSVIVILAGINDIAGNTGPSTLEMIEDNLASMVDLAKVNGVPVVLSSVLPAFDFPWRPGMQPAETVVDLNVWIKKYAEENGCVYLDYFTPMADEKHALKGELTLDGVHPTLAGYKVMEPLVEAAIQKALGMK